MNTSELVTVLLTAPEDFFDYDKLFKEIYADLAGKVKNNHIFSCGGSVDDEEVTFITLRQSNLECHSASNHKVSKKSRRLRSPADVRSFSEKLTRVNYVGMNPYKVVEMYKNYRPNVPPEFHDNVLYAEPTAAQWAKVKVERADRAEFRATNKRKKYTTADMLEGMAFDDNAEMKDGDGGN